jgi:glutamine synthetase
MSFYITSYTIVAEYVWIGGLNELRSKSRVIKIIKDSISVKDMPDWDFDGSSTGQAQTENSEIILKPCALYKDPFRYDNCFIVLCSTFLPDGSPAINNHRFKAEQVFKDCDKMEMNCTDPQIPSFEYVFGINPQFGLEQEYFIYDCNTDEPLEKCKVLKQGQFYCSVGAKNAFGRKIVEEHFKKCLEIGLGITGINAEVAPGQWEFQIFGNGIAAADNLIVSRYLLERVSEDYNAYIVWHPKPLQTGNWNGSGLHTNFSTKAMRDSFQQNKDTTEIFKAIRRLELTHDEHMAVYGQDNELRLTGDCETSSFKQFKRGQNSGDRSASIRIRNGYLEDRRPASNADPYLVCSKIYETITKEDIETKETENK